MSAGCPSGPRSVPRGLSPAPVHVPNLLVLVAALLASPSSATTQVPSWQLLPNSPSHSTTAVHRYEDVAFVSHSRGWVISLDSVFRTSDGGRSWSAQPMSGKSLRSLGFVNESVGWIGTLNPDQPLFETRDGGETWQDISARLGPEPPLGICGIWVVNEQVVYGVGRFVGAAHLIKSVDGGRTWVTKDMRRYASTLVDVYFFNELTGVAVGGTHPARNGGAVVLRTEDGGETWRVVHETPPRQEWAWKISFPTPRVGYVSVESLGWAKVLKTEDGGRSWSETYIPGLTRLQAVGFLDESTGWVGGDGGSALTTDGGRSWTVYRWPDVKLGSPARVNRIRFSLDSVAHAVGVRTYVLRHDVTGR